MLTLKLGQADIPVIVTNHTYDVIGAYVPTKEMGGGSGLKYAATSNTTCPSLRRRTVRKLSAISSRPRWLSHVSKENQQVGIHLFYDERGLDRYYGLLELGEQVACGRT